jgi:hypothetical protein
LALLWGLGVLLFYIPLFALFSLIHDPPAVIRGLQFTVIVGLPVVLGVLVELRLGRQDRSD